MSDVQPFKRRTVLVVEDDHDLRASFRTILGPCGISRPRGARWASRAETDSICKPPDVVVLDLMLPNVSGLDVQHEITSNVYTSAIPIVIVTGTSLDLDHLPVSCILRKPVMPDELVLAVQRCLLARSDLHR